MLKRRCPGLDCWTGVSFSRFVLPRVR
jgi:hypothetical protein